MRDLATLSAREVIALAIYLEGEYERVCRDFSEGLREEFPEHATMLLRIGQAGSARGRRLMDFFHSRFGAHIPLVRRIDVRGFAPLKALWLVRPLNLNLVGDQVETIGRDVWVFYSRVFGLVEDAEIRELLCTFLHDDSLYRHRTEQLFPDETWIKGSRPSWVRRLLGWTDVFQ